MLLRVNVISCCTCVCVYLCANECVRACMYIRARAHKCLYACECVRVFESKHANACLFVHMRVNWCMCPRLRICALQLLLYEATHDYYYEIEVIGSMARWMPRTIQHTPCGLAYFDHVGPTRYAGGSLPGCL